MTEALTSEALFRLKAERDLAHAEFVRAANAGHPDALGLDSEFRAADEAWTLAVKARQEARWQVMADLHRRNRSETQAGWEAAALDLLDIHVETIGRLETKLEDAEDALAVALERVAALEADRV